eukprot:SAG22_NODE_576_length_8982_cov_21.167736_2_plen_287_part_00
MQLLQLLLLLLLPAARADCGGSPCIVAASCNSADTNSTRWMLSTKTIDGLTATNLLLRVPEPGTGTGACTSCQNANCAKASACHLWGPGFGDRNGFFQLVNKTDGSFTVHSWPATKSVPVGPMQTPPGWCLTALNPGGPLAAGDGLHMAPYSAAAILLVPQPGGELQIHQDVPTADTLCLGAPPPPPQPPAGRPEHYFSCTPRLAGGPRLAHPFCNASLGVEQRLDNLLELASCAEKAAAMTSSGAAIPRLGVPKVSRMALPSLVLPLELGLRQCLPLQTISRDLA